MRQRRKTLFCKLTHRLISRAEARGKKMPRFAERHSARCGACREYARFAASLPSWLSGDRPAFLAAVPDFRLGEVQWVEDGIDPGRRETLRRRLLLHPFPAAAAALIVIAGALILFQVVLRESSLSPEERAAALATLKSVTSAPDGFQGMVKEAESPLAKERQILERSVASAVEFLQARLNIRIERREIPKTL
jgi:hypothetical protein